MITPVILCGGSGNRLWPVSRASFPKQFAPLVGCETLFQKSALRSLGAEFTNPLVVTNSNFRFIVKEQLQAISITPDAILLEPAQRNTAPAILAAAIYLAQKDPETAMLVLPSDQMLHEVEDLKVSLKLGLAEVARGQIVTFGITPTYPETAYGYLEIPKPVKHGPIQPIGFIEKPDAARAQEMVKSGSFLWNAGIFLFKAKDILTAFETHAPDLVKQVTKAIKTSKDDRGFYRLKAEEWASVENISIDYAIMEKAQNLSVVHLACGWADLGSWDAIWRESPKDNEGLTMSGATTSIGCNNTLLRSDSEGLEVVGIGLNNIIAVAMTDAVLVADISRAQDVQKAVDALKAKNATQASAFLKDHRPWGWFERLVIGDCFQVKRIHVKPKAALSLQSHLHRAEHWIIVKGTAEVSVDETVQQLHENHSIFIPVGAKHRIKNLTKYPMVLIEVQTGRYLSEDDIMRYEDIYSRG